MRLMGVTFMKEERGILSDQMCTEAVFAHPFLPSLLFLIMWWLEVYFGDGNRSQ